ncbi:MAG: hypothetical protein KAR06_11070 [Deltaproteobacteria bacterium]|nr:hypothetical protein [Deltaproteobacteria bacterium]
MIKRIIQKIKLCNKRRVDKKVLIEREVQVSDVEMNDRRRRKYIEKMSPGARDLYKELLENTLRR